ncbi:RDD family protein [Nonomuraea sp. NPDC050556]|uniref:RDD family protein n=1 Tax=Nonomuraea sp. NPDC050556 TaxID=3364369 RepID=UPI0037AA1B3A
MSEVVTGDAVVVEVRVAQLPTRAVALFIDMVLQVVVLAGTLILLGLFAVFSDPAMFAAVAILLVVLVTIGYPVLVETLTRGRSLGKLAMGLRVVSDDGSPERFRQAMFRGLAGFVEFWMLYGAPALISSLVSQQGKRLGDVFAGTIVISERGPAASTTPAVMPPQLAQWASTLELSQLNSEVAAAARQYLLRWHQLSPAMQYEMGVRISTQVAAVVSPAPPHGVPPHAYLSAVLAERRRRDEARLASRSSYAHLSQGPSVQAYVPPVQAPPPGFGAPLAAPPYPQTPVTPEGPRTTPGGFAPPV